MLFLLLACAPKPPPASAEPAVLDFPTLEAVPDQREIRAVTRARVRGREIPVGFHALLTEGDDLGGWRYGQLVDVEGQPIATPTGEPLICGNADYGSLTEAGGRRWLTTHFECQPGAVYLTELVQDPATGLLSPGAGRPLDLSAIGGGNNFCAGDITPWGTHLASEEYEADAQDLQADGTIPTDPEDYDLVALYWQGDLSRTTPYRYGWIPEITLDGQGGATVVQHFAMGRFSHEQARVLPDRRTVYLSDDGQGGAFFLFVADEAGDLSAGRLYAARWEQADGEAARLSWVPLGHASDAEIAGGLDATFASLLTAAPTTPIGGCPPGFQSVHTRWGHECLRPVPGRETLLSRLEARRAAAMLGATTELNKTEGIAFDPATATLYVAATDIGEGMLAAHPEWDRGGPDHLRLDANPCGAVFALPLAGGVSDTAGEPMDSAFVATSAHVALAGHPVPGEERCAEEGIANPDNLAFIDEAGLLLVAEDTERHDNDALWAWDPRDRRLTRLLTAPPGAEVSGLDWHRLGAWSYVGLTVQHPWRDVEAAPQGARRSVTGYLGPFPDLR